ncbi:DUF4234 domain-containing protein [Trujillonella humicola]|uniref:DUF4234 domain-containing protein n=1 Tax=Trujillonella humicola TaxID=3383699 RepID=UPI003906B874
MTTPATPPSPGRPDPAPPFAQASPAGAAGYAPMPEVPGLAPYGQPAGRSDGPPGRLRPTGMTILLVVVTLGIWALVYYFQVHEEMRRHSGQGLGGVWALVIALIFGLVNPFLLSDEVGRLYERRGQDKPVSALTALWFFPGMLILVGPFIWFVRTNRALNAYWQSLGVRETTLV